MSNTYRLITQITALLLASCLSAGAWSDDGNHSGIPEHKLDYDLVMAEIPYRQAPIAAAALAQLQVALHQARKQAEQALCDGHWTPRGTVLGRTGPTPGVKPGNQASVWRYRSVRQAHPLNCANVSRAQFFLEMSRHLPAWVIIRPAGQLTAFRQGESYIAPPTSMASR